jgi:hypothetical protein
MKEKNRRAKAHGNSIIQLSGIGGEILISKIENFKKTKKEFQYLSSTELFQHIINDSKITIDNKICHMGGIFFNESVKLNWKDPNNNESVFLYDDLYEDSDYYFNQDEENGNCLLGSLNEGYYLIYIGQGKVYTEDLSIELKEISPDLIELITFRIGEIDEAELDAEDDYYICNKIKIIDEQNEENNSLLDLEFDDSGLEINFFIIHTDGNWGYKIIYQNEEWI